MKTSNPAVNPGVAAFATIASEGAFGAVPPEKAVLTPDPNRPRRTYLQQVVHDTLQNRTAVFGPGIHHCVGHYLARVELDVLFRRLVDRVAKMEANTSNLKFQVNPVFRGLEALPVRFAA